MGGRQEEKGEEVDVSTVTFEVRFVLGRYHTTPWDRHVNEGVSEWPPSPWRLTRALYCIWKERCPDLAEPDVLEALDLIARAPVFELPPTLGSSTRHWYPDSGHRSGSTSGTSKVIDAFLALDRSTPLRIHWDGHLSAGAQTALGSLVEHLTYLGRADSCCEATVEFAGGKKPREVPPGWELWAPDDDGPRRVMTPSRPLVKEELTITTDEMRRDRLLTPTGARSAGYVVEGVPQETVERRHEAFSERPTMMLLSVAGAPAPPLTQTLVAAEWLRTAVLSRIQVPEAAAEFSGHQPDGSARTDQHGHSHVLPLAGPDGRISALVIWSPDGLHPLAVEAAASVHRCGPAHNGDRYRPKGIAPFGVTTVALGGDDRVPAVLRGPARSWRSLTPFVPARHQKARRFSGARTGVLYHDFIEDEIRRELSYRGLPPAQVRVFNPRLPVQRFRRHRLRESLADAKQGIAVELDFDEPVSGPIALGRLSHFGLGIFHSERSS